jgi:molybdopterin molybdotransferase
MSWRERNSCGRSDTSDKMPLSASCPDSPFESRRTRESNAGLSETIGMIEINEALNLVLRNLPKRRTETVRFDESLGYVLAENLIATRNLPPFRRSSKDGYAVRASDVRKVPVELKIAGEVRAGDKSASILRRGEAISIMTGAVVPEGADAVQMIEYTEKSSDGSRVTIKAPVKPGQDIAPIGADAKLGKTIIESGRLIGPAEIAVMASFGHCIVKVWRKPSVAILATGSELVGADETPAEMQIRNSNSHSISGQLRLMGWEAAHLGIAPDEIKALRKKVRLGLKKDVLIITGGVSMGKYDLVKDVFRDLGLKVLFSKVAMKPGKPTVFARLGDKLIFGLPGNPVSSFMAFENFVRPALAKLAGHDHAGLFRIRGELQRELKQTPGRTSFLPAWTTWSDDKWMVEPLKWKGSPDFFRFSRANAAVIFPADRNRLKSGEIVECMLFPDFLVRWR